MKTTTLIASLALVFAAGSALAQEAGSDAWMNPTATKSRTQVQAELAQARQDGTIKAWSAGYIETLQSRQSRADVLASVRTAIANGEIERINAEAWGFDRQLPAINDTRLARATR